MLDLKSPESVYNNDMHPLSDVLKVAISTYRLQFKELVLKYKEKFLSRTGQIEFEEFIGKILPEIEKMLSKPYKTKTLSKYFTEYGRIAIIHDALKTMFMAEYDELARSF